MNQFINYISNITESNKYSKISLFWKEQYNSFNFNNETDFIPSESEIQNIRTWNSRSAMGNGDPNNQLEWANKSYFRLINAFPDKQVLKNFLINLYESDFGNPIKLKTDIGNYSGMFYLNIIQTYIIYNTIKKFYTIDIFLDICEIGSGWGQCCEILNQKLFLSSYTSIDLKETLILSYLNAIHNFNSSDIQLINDCTEKKYNYCIPEKIYNLENNNKQYDIFINWYSFQEMTKENVISYINFIKNKLKKGGLFISSNSWGYDRYEIKNFSDLQLHNFKIIDIYKDPRSIGCKQLVIVCKNIPNDKEININKLNELALDLRNDKIYKEQFLNDIYL